MVYVPFGLREPWQKCCSAALYDAADQGRSGVFAISRKRNRNCGDDDALMSHHGANMTQR